MKCVDAHYQVIEEFEKQDRHNTLVHYYRRRCDYPCLLCARNDKEWLEFHPDRYALRN